MDAPAEDGGKTLAAVWQEQRDKGTTDSPDAEASYALAQAAQAAMACADSAGAARKEDEGNAAPASFAIGKASVLFSPSPVVSIPVYEGSLSDYDDALVNKVPVANIPLPDGCRARTRACVTSPWPLSRCSKCDSLKSGRTYTAFLPERVGQRHSEVKSVRFQR